MKIENDDIDDKYRIAFKLQRTPSIKEFIPRNSELEQIEQHLLPGSTKQMRRKVFVLHGVGGSGKSQLALEFARKHQRTFSAVFWLNGDTKYHLEQCIADIALQLPDEHLSEACRRFRDGSSQDIDLVVKHVLEWFTESGNNKWLLIFDNVDRDQSLQDADAYDVVSYFPNADQGSILVTTRLTRLGQLGKSLRLQGMTPEQGSRLLHSHIGRPVEGSEELVKELGGLPLALAQAGAFMHQTNSSVDEYLRYYRETWSRLFEETSKSLLQNDSQPVVTTWELSYRQVENEDSNAAKLLQVCSCLSSWDIWYGLFSPLLTEEAEQTNNIPDWFRVCIQGELNFKRAIKTLLDYSMLEPRNEFSTFSMHPVVHDWCFNRKLDERKSIFQLVIITVASAIVDKGKDRPATILRRLFPHCDRVLRLVQEFESDFNKGVEMKWLADSSHYVGLVFQEFGKLGEAESMCKLSLVQKSKILGTEHPSTIETLTALGTIYYDQNKLEMSRQTLEMAMSMAKNRLGYHNKITLNIVQSLGNLYWVQRRLKDAEDMYEIAQKGLDDMYGPGNMHSLAILGNKINIYIEKGKLRKAEKLAVHLVKSFEATLGSENTSTLSAVSNLGGIYFRQGRLKKAEEMYLRALKGFGETLGSRNYKTMAVANELANVYFAQKRFEEAEDLYQQASVVVEETYGPKHSNTLTVMENLEHVRGKIERSKKRSLLYSWFCR